MREQTATEHESWQRTLVGPLDQHEVRIDAIDDTMAIDDNLDVSSGAAVCLGMVCMSKGARPDDLVWWVRYHLSLGVYHFFLRVEDASDATRSTLASEEWASCVHASFADGLHVRDCGGLQVARQDEHVQRSIVAAQRAGCTHLLHIDDDELLYLPSGPEELWAHIRGAPPHAAELHVRNLEALAPDTGCTEPFREVSCFRHRPVEYAGYGQLRGSTGKSIGVLRHPGLVPIG